MFSIEIRIYDWGQILEVNSNMFYYGEDCKIENKIDDVTVTIFSSTSKSERQMTETHKAIINWGQLPLC